MKSKNGETTLADVVQSVHDLSKAMTRELRDLRRSVDRMDGRFENFLVTAGSRSLDHEVRIAQLELDIAELKGL